GFEPGAAVDERAVGAAEVFDIKLAAAGGDSRVASRDTRRRVEFRKVDVGPDTSMRVDATDGDFVFRRQRELSADVHVHQDQFAYRDLHARRAFAEIDPVEVARRHVATAAGAWKDRDDRRGAGLS